MGHACTQLKPADRQRGVHSHAQPAAVNDVDVGDCGHALNNTAKHIVIPLCARMGGVA